MTNDLSNAESSATGFTETPSAQKAADDLRAAAGQSAAQTVSSPEERAQQLKEAASRKAQQLREFAGEKAEQVRDAVSGEKAQQLKSKAGEQWQDTRVRASELHGELEEYVRQHPTQSILTAAGIGLLCGLILRR